MEKWTVSNTFQAQKRRYIQHNWLDNGWQGTFVNRELKGPYRRNFKRDIPGSQRLPLNFRLSENENWLFYIEISL